MSNSKKITVLGIDPGLANTGWMLVGLAGGRYSRLSGGTVVTRSTEPTGERLLSIRDVLVAEIEGAGAVDAVAIENVYWGRNVTSCISTAKAIGLLEVLAAERGIEVLTFTPQQVKNSCGMGGKATKATVKNAVSRLLAGAGAGMSNHETDAGAVALAGLLSLRCGGRAKNNYEK